MPYRPITPELYDSVIEFYRKEPGAVSRCADRHGMDPRTAKRLWEGPPSKNQLWMTPAREVLAAERAKAEKEQRDREESQRAALAAEQEKARKLQDEMQRMDENILRLAKADVIGSLGSLARLNEGMNQLAERLGKQLREGKDKTGKELDIDPIEAMRILRGFTGAVKSMTEAAQVLVSIDRVKQNLPTSIIGVDVSNVTLEDAIDEIRRAEETIVRAQNIGLIPKLPAAPARGAAARNIDPAMRPPRNQYTRTRVTPPASAQGVVHDAEYEDDEGPEDLPREVSH